MAGVDAGPHGARSDPMLLPPSVTLWTLGHSTREWEEFLALLVENRIERLVDVRHYPSSGRAPWANRANLAASLAAENIGYEHLVDLGGYRTPRADSKNRGWRNAGFRGYADHMNTPEFASALDRLLDEARARRTAIMCAEAVPWKCHRSLLSDSLLARGVRVVHILSAGKSQDHILTAFARVRGGTVTYPEARAKR